MNWIKEQLCLGDLLIQLHFRLKFFTLIRAWQHLQYFISIALIFLLPCIPLRGAPMFLSQLYSTIFSFSFSWFYDSFPLCVHLHHSCRWLSQKKGSVVCPVGWQSPAEPRGSLFVRKWFSRCWGGHSKSSPAISVMALRRCCLCPVMVTDDWLGRWGPSRD